MCGNWDEVNALSEGDFVARFGFLFEHSPWIVAAAAKARPFADIAAMHGALLQVVETATAKQKLVLLQAHPKLADKAALAAGLTQESASEQASAGLDQLTADEFERFHALNSAYDAQFGFPFIIAVRLAGGKTSILDAMESRLGNSRETELAAALAEVGKIVRLRLEDALG